MLLISSSSCHLQVIYLGGELVSVDGTSASTPVIAAMIALINDARIKIGMSPMGFLNPWLYATAAKFPSAFVDITQGDNNCTANAQICCPFGLPATPGWDASTGLGTPNFLKYDFFFFSSIVLMLFVPSLVFATLR